MQLVLDASDFRRLSKTTQGELLALLQGRSASPPAVDVRAEHGSKSSDIKWREPVALSKEDAQRLVSGLTETQRAMLKHFANNRGRAKMSDLMGQTGEKHLRAVSQFQTAMTRRLRRVIHDPDKKAQLFAWDFDKTKWDDKKTTIVDGEYYVHPDTAARLKTILK